MRLTPKSRRLAGATAVLASGILTAAVATVSPAAAAPTWAPADTAAIHPGTMMYTEGAQCTANFVYTDAQQQRVRRLRRPLRRPR